jgi:gamma-glutamylcyclotransferase (GGCT)/AIG2-like uncharacterized protein YtfP
VQMQTDAYLFAYGTLRKSFRFQAKAALENELAHIGEAIVKASLYDLGDYPGAVRENESDEVTGDVFLICNPNTVLPVLDAYEGDQYRRAQEKVVMQNARELEAWIYWYGESVKDKKKIGNGDYVDYLSSKRVLSGSVEK